MRKESSFIWDPVKEAINIRKHGIDFITAAEAFKDINRKIAVDEKHDEKEPRYFCLGKVRGKVITVRFTYRNGKIRIFGAGFWRKGAAYYEKEENRRK